MLTELPLSGNLVYMNTDCDRHANQVLVEDPEHGLVAVCEGCFALLNPSDPTEVLA